MRLLPPDVKMERKMARKMARAKGKLLPFDTILPKVLDFDTAVLLAPKK